jgi:EAL domain-containing protein (putative c-di-GMP-specific phosphodiesterase class I)
LQTTLREVIEQGSFELYYQPQIDVMTDLVVGVEALLRVQRDGQFIPAPMVIATAETVGLMTELTDHIVEREGRDARRLGGLGFDLTMSFNVSAKDLSSGTLADRVIEVAKRHRIDSSRFMVELTEEAVLTDPQAAAATVNRLRSLGFRVSMDDFGVGFSSLTNLRTLAVDELKIDSSFVEGMVSDARTRALVSAIVDLARRLDSHVLIEGVERLEDVAVVRELGIDLIQGWAYAKAMPLPDLVQWMTERGQVPVGQLADARGPRWA